jgi:hypothetical protein
MTENLAKYIPLALRIGSTENARTQIDIGGGNTQNQVIVTNRNPFLVDAKFSLRLDEII